MTNNDSKRNNSGRYHHRPSNDNRTVSPTQYRSYGQPQPKGDEVFLVLEGTKVCSVYRWREDANNHAAVVGGAVVMLQIKENTPQWVKTMLESSQDKALRQSGLIRD